jgi:hypothetical protein
LVTLAPLASSEPAMSPWRSGANQLTVPPTLTPRRVPAASRRLSVVVAPDAIRTTDSEPAA